MNINFTEQITLKELMEKIRKIRENEDIDVWIEGNGDGSIKFVFTEKSITLI